MRTTLGVAVGVLVCCALGCNAGKGGPRSSGSLAASNDSAYLYAADSDNGALIVLDAKSMAKVAQVKVGERPYRVAVGADDTVFVANRGSRSVSVIARGDWSVRTELKTGVDPVGMQTSLDGKTLYVVSATASDTAEWGILQAFDVSTLAEEWSVPVGEEPRGLAVTSNERALVSLYKEGELVQVDLTKGQVVNGRIGVYGEVNRSELTSASTVEVRGSSPTTFTPRATGDLAATPDGKRVFAPSQLSREAPILVAPSATRPYYQEQGPRLAGSVTTPAVFTFDTANDQVVPRVDDVSNEPTGAVVGFGGSSQSNADYPQTSYVVRSASTSGFIGGEQPQNPVMQGPSVAVVDQSGQWLFLVNRESSNVAAISASSRQAKSGYSSYFDELPSVHSTVKTGAGADGIALLGDGATAYVYNQFDHSVQQLALGSKGLVAGTTVRVADDVLTPEQAAGRRMFFDANDRQISSESASVACSSCHLEGRDDGHVWKFPDGPRQTPTLAGRGMQSTGPYHWTGEFKTLDDFLNHTVIQRMGGTGLKDTSQRLALEAYVDSLPAPENPNKKAELTEQQRRGSIAFARAECGVCHSGEWLTNNTIEDVGTFDANPVNPDTERALNVPSLRGLARSSPYLHSGKSRTLKERLMSNPGDKHGKTSILSAQELDDLVAYLKTL